MDLYADALDTGEVKSIMQLMPTSLSPLRSLGWANKTATKNRPGVLFQFDHPDEPGVRKHHLDVEYNPRDTLEINFPSIPIDKVRRVWGVSAHSPAWDFYSMLPSFQPVYRVGTGTSPDFPIWPGPFPWSDSAFDEIMHGVPSEIDSRKIVEGLDRLGFPIQRAPNYPNDFDFHLRHPAEEGQIPKQFLINEAMAPEGLRRHMEALRRNRGRSTAWPTLNLNLRPVGRPVPGAGTPRQFYDYTEDFFRGDLP